MPDGHGQPCRFSARSATNGAVSPRWRSRRGSPGGAAPSGIVLYCETWRQDYRRLAFGTARLSGSVSKYASWAKLNMEAMKLVGIDWIALLYVITESL
jgi:hypothetical protein